MPSYAKNDHSTTTGPGQTYEKLRNEWRFLVVTSPQIVQGKEPVLYGAPVMCTQLKQVVTSIDASTALGVTGVVRFISAADLKLIGAANKVEKTHILRHFILKTIILPRQARDKRREGTAQKNVSRGVYSGQQIEADVSFNDTVRVMFFLSPYI